MAIDGYKNKIRHNMHRSLSRSYLDHQSAEPQPPTPTHSASVPFARLSYSDPLIYRFFFNKYYQKALISSQSNEKPYMKGVIWVRKTDWGWISGNIKVWVRHLATDSESAGVLPSAGRGSGQSAGRCLVLPPTTIAMATETPSSYTTTPCPSTRRGWVSWGPVCLVFLLDLTIGYRSYGFGFGFLCHGMRPTLYFLVIVFLIACISYLLYILVCSS